MLNATVPIFQVAVHSTSLRYSFESRRWKRRDTYLSLLACLLILIPLALLQQKVFFQEGAASTSLQQSAPPSKIQWAFVPSKVRACTVR